MEKQEFIFEITTNGSSVVMELVNNTGELVAILTRQAGEDGNTYSFNIDATSDFLGGGEFNYGLAYLLQEFVKKIQEERENNEENTSFSIKIKMNKGTPEKGYMELAQILDKRNYIDGYRIEHEKNTSVKYLILEIR